MLVIAAWFIADPEEPANPVTSYMTSSLKEVVEQVQERIATLGPPVPVMA